MKSCSKNSQEGKSCLKLLEPKKVAPNAKRCSKVAEHNRDMPNTSNFPHATAMQHFTTIALPSPEKYCGCIRSFKVYYNNACFLLIEAAEIVQPIVNSRPLLDGNLKIHSQIFASFMLPFWCSASGCHAC